MNALPSIAQSGMKAALLRLGTAAHHIANASTPGMRRQSVQQEALPGGGVRVSIGRTTGLGNDLAHDIVEQMSAVYAFKANLGVIRTQDGMLGSLLDLKA